METTAQHTNRQEYTQGINQLLSDIRLCSFESKGNIGARDQIKLQGRLDALADLYQEDTPLGPIRYKLYFAQALLCYYNDENDRAFEFVNQAEQLKGGSFELGDKLKKQITENIQPTEDESMDYAKAHPKLVGLEGWLALFMAGLVVTFGVNAYGFYTTFSTYSSLAANVTNQYPGITTLILFEMIVNIAFCVSMAWLFFSLLRRDKSARMIAIAILCIAVLLAFIDYTWASSMFSNNPDALKTITNASNVGKIVWWAIVWVPYFIWSKRVKATLTK